MKAKQAQKNCQSFMNYLYTSEQYQPVRDLLYQWKDNDQLHIGAIDAFQKISALLQGENCDQILLQLFNRCLIKEIPPQKINVSLNNISFPDLRENSRPEQVLTDFREWINQDKAKLHEKTQIVSVGPKISNFPQNPVAPTSIEILKENEFIEKFLSLRQSQMIAKFVLLYLKCIITQEELRALILPVYSLNPSLFYWLLKYAQIVRTKRYKRTIFSPLIDLVNYKYPFDLVGVSYIMIPDGYAKCSKGWKNRDPAIEATLNRKCCLVPLVGSEQEFFISPKTDSERQMFHLEDQGYQIDYTLQCIKACIRQIQNACQKSPISGRSYRLQNAMMKRVISELYPNDNVYTIFMRNIELAKDVLLPRLKQKEWELRSNRPKFIKAYSDAASKHFHKGLDYRYFHFAYNDKKYNSLNFWEKEIALRKKTIQEDYKEQTNEMSDDKKIAIRKKQTEIMEEQDENSDSDELKKEAKQEKDEEKKKCGQKIEPSVFIRSRYEPVNTFDNVIGKLSQKNQEEEKKYEIILREGRFSEEDFDLRVQKEEQEKAETKMKTEKDYDHQMTAQYPKYPDNQILFIMDFSNNQILNDVLEIVLYHCPSSRKRLFELLIFKTFRKNINLKLPKFNSLISSFDSQLQNSQNLGNTKITKEDSAMSGLNYPEEGLLNWSKDAGHRQFFGNTSKNEEDEFMEMIEQQQQITYLDQMSIPFELPKNKKFYTLIGTKIMYMILRSILTMYQRFLKAKQYQQQSYENNPSSQDKCYGHYHKFLAILIYKIKDKKNFEDSLRKVFNQDGYIFFTLDKILLGAIKFINSITNSQLAYKILKDQTKDFEFQLFSWDKFPFPSASTQLYRLIGEKQKLFSFNYDPFGDKLYISCWFPPYHDVKQTIENRNRNIQEFMVKPVSKNPTLVQGFYHKELSEYLYTTITKQGSETGTKSILMQNRTPSYRGQSLLINSKKWNTDNRQIYETEKKKIQLFLSKYAYF